MIKRVVYWCSILIQQLSTSKLTIFLSLKINKKQNCMPFTIISHDDLRRKTKVNMPGFTQKSADV